MLMRRVQAMLPRRRPLRSCASSAQIALHKARRSPRDLATAMSSVCTLRLSGWQRQDGCVDRRAWDADDRDAVVLRELTANGGRRQIGLSVHEACCWMSEFC